jgi:hypothetical protein
MLLLSILQSILWLLVVYYFFLVIYQLGELNGAKKESKFTKENLELAKKILNDWEKSSEKWRDYSYNLLQQVKTMELIIAELKKNPDDN